MGESVGAEMPDENPSLYHCAAQKRVKTESKALNGVYSGLYSKVKQTVADIKINS